MRARAWTLGGRAWTLEACVDVAGRTFRGVDGGCVDVDHGDVCIFCIISVRGWDFVGARAWTLGGARGRWGGARGRWGRAWTWRGGRSGVSMVGVSMLIGEGNFSANYWYSQTPLHRSSYRYTPPQLPLTPPHNA